MDQAHTRKRKEGGVSFMRAILWALFISALTLTLLLLLSSFIALKSANPSQLIPPLGGASALIGALLCGYLAARMRGRQGLLVGGAAGLAYLALFLLALAALVGDGDLHLGRVLLSYLIFFVLSVLGGVLGTIKRTPKKRRRRTH